VTNEEKCTSAFPDQQIYWTKNRWRDEKNLRLGWITKFESNQLTSRGTLGWRNERNISAIGRNHGHRFSNQNLTIQQETLINLHILFIEAEMWVTSSQSFKPRMPMDAWDINARKILLSCCLLSNRIY
jgi:hypothetical protein